MTRAYHYQTLFDQANDAIALVEFDAGEPIIRDTNQEFRDIFAPEAADLIGRDLDEVVTTEDQVVEARQLTARAQRGEVTRREVRRETVDGARDFLWQIIPIEDDDDGFTETAFVVYTDITERVAQQVRLEESEERYRRLLATAPSPIFIYTTDGTLIYANEAAVEFVDANERAEILGSAAGAFTQEDSQPDVEKRRDRLVEQREAVPPIEEKLKTMRGETKHAIVASAPITYEGEPAIQTVVTDVTELKRREQQLLEERAFNQLALDSVIDFYWQLDTDGFVTEWSDTDGSVTGYPSAEAVGMHATEFFPEREREYIEEQVTELLETGSTTAEADFRKKDGELVPYRFDGTVLTDEEDEVETLCGFGRDISEQVERERELQEERDYTAQLIETIPDVFYMAGVDGTLREWNERVPEVTGLSPDSIADMQALEFFAEEDWNRVGQAIEETLTTGQATVEADVLTDDGDRIPYEFTGGRLTDSDGELMGLVGIGRDISERIAHEAELERYETLVEASGDPMYMLDPDGHFRYVNEALVEIAGYAKEDLIGAHVEKVMDEEDIESGEELIGSLLSAGDRRGTFEMEFSPKEGESIPAENHISLIYDEGEFRGTVGVLRDISARLERERRLQRERDRLDEFAGVLSHDLRNPLNVAQGRLELAQDECESDHLDAVVRAQHRMEQLISDVLSLARAGAAIGETEVVELSALVETCWRNVDTDSAELFVESDVTIQADKIRLQQLIENLFRNAVEHGEGDVVIRIGEYPSGFYVEDDGPGIPVDVRSKVLEPGYSTSERGTGFGLSIVRDIAEAHGWMIDITSSEAGGARFEFTSVEFAD